MPRLQYRKNGQYFHCKHGWEFVVEGSVYTFPFDMLRHDRCYPLSESEARTLRTDVVKTKTRRVALKTMGDHLTPRRWESFGWEIISMFPLNKDGRRQIEGIDGDVFKFYDANDKPVGDRDEVLYNYEMEDDSLI